MTTFTEAAALDWLAAPGWRTAHGPDIVPDEPGDERVSELTSGEWHENAGCAGNEGDAGFPVGREFRVFRL